MQFVNNETGKTVATLPDITKADEKAREKVKKEQKLVAKEWGAKIKKKMAEDESAIEKAKRELAKLEWYDSSFKRILSMSDHIKEATFVQRHGKWWLFEKVR
ncbi:hypothetical protein [Limosilactobacillus ingluviei]|uniref:Uncharacterized protein n=1 Tax=Limosilactobacillus ingluviei DSM 15946 TaxID=1423760 RepID=A0A0R1UKZ4_9LACO|nr:hypothetical protein [Limosilactobacillus ingluviei]KRL91637.1 hypothetical protein FC43_GL001055 [Limosilactobacillus ingluviei DSM 15946]